MKMFIGSLVIFALIIVGGIIYKNALDDIVEKSNEIVMQIDAAIKAEDFALAAMHFSKLDEKWQKQKKLLMAMVDHLHLASIDICLASLSQSIYYADAKDAADSSAVLKELFKSINDSEQLLIENVF